MVKDEQSKIMNSYYDLENRYKEIIHENKKIKNEILDLRKTKSILSRKDPNFNKDMPLNKTME